MYSTKLVNKNLVDNNAYISIGDPYKDQQQNVFRQPKKGEAPPKPMVMVQKPQNQENGNFSKVEYNAGNYREGNLYIESQPLDARKKGFGSRDAHRRDEFSNSVRTEQYRAQLIKEMQVSEKDAPRLLEELNKLKTERLMTADSVLTKRRGCPLNETYSSFVPQYDIGRTRVTPFDPKSIKDTYYKFDTNLDKRYGPMVPTSNTIGDSAWDLQYKPPKYGGKSEVRNFFDKSHLRV